MSEIVYEEVTSVPVESIVELYEAGGWWREDPAWREVIPAMVRGSFCFLVARDAGGRLVGMGRAISDGVSDAYIQDVVVRREHRGHGVGREIVRRLTLRCVEAGISWIGLVAEPGTRGFYETLGYRAQPGFELMLHEEKSDGS
ncbi:MAG: GNAT family N-acetyltransferase [Thermoanaerobaculaceae bacterium]|jgi:GNAT superfamily N-acetyltransferase|nr:GNAT family N-acetyltransferase [Thermoanaerobaculaceae bacterium]